MNITIILAHPVTGSFNHAIAEAVAAELRAGGHDVSFHALYSEGFEPLLPGVEIFSQGEPSAAMR